MSTDKTLDLVPHNINRLESFISGWYIRDETLCDQLIDYHKNSPKKEKGQIGAGRYVPSYKDSTDVVLQDQDLIVKFKTEFNLVLEHYQKQYPGVTQYFPFGLVEWINIQHYNPGQGFHAWHTERPGRHDHTMNRVLVFIMYLNDVFEKGETEWYHQRFKIQPRKGLTMIWPVDWCFTHRGITSKTQEKYIATGWLSFLDTPVK